MDEEEFRAWLSEQPQETSTLIAARAALRVFPLVLASENTRGEGSVLALLAARAILTSGVGAKMPSSEIRAAALAAISATGGFSATTNATTNAATRAAYAAAGAAGAAEAAFAVEAAANAAAYASAGATANVAAYAAANAAARAAGVTAYDAAFLDTTIPTDELFRSPIWHSVEIPHALRSALSTGENLLKTGPEWAFWRDWYQGFLDGKPLDWELQRRVALIPDDDWEKGLAHIAGKIEEIRARFELEQRINELEREVVLEKRLRHGVGGNFPPEPIEEAQKKSSELTIVWAPLRDIKEEVEADEPDKTKIRVAIEALSKALARGLAWSGSKADLAVDTAIKWAIPAAGGGYLAMNPDKLSAVIEAAKTWLSALP